MCFLMSRKRFFDSNIHNGEERNFRGKKNVKCPDDYANNESKQDQCNNDAQPTVATRPLILLLWKAVAFRDYSIFW